MRIGPSFAPVGVAARRGVGGGDGAAGFAERLGSRPAGGAAVAGFSPLTSLGAVLAVQEVDDPLVGRRRARARGERVLDALDELRVALLDGGLPPARLAALRELASGERHRADDPGLQAVLDEIELRAAVELAKLERDRDPA